MATKIQLRRDTEANWTSANPTLASGEIGVETDTNKFKVGDGSTAWNGLDYQGGSVAASNGLTIDDGVVKLGGELDASTSITGESDKVLSILIGSAGVTQVSGLVATASSMALQHYDQTATKLSGISISDDLTQISSGDNGIQLSSDETTIYLFSPNGTKYRLIVDDSGALSTTAA